MSVETVKERLAEIEAEIDGIKVAYAQGPDSLDGANMPLFVNLTRASTFDWIALGADDNLDTRQYVAQLYVCPYGSGIPGEAERKTQPFFPLVRDKFSGLPGLRQLESVQDFTLLGDSGVIVLSYPLAGGPQFWGVEFRLQVKEYIERVYCEGD